MGAWYDAVLPSAAVKILSTPRLTIRLGAVRRNYERLAKTSAPAKCGAAVKANGYGLGAVAVSRTLSSAGCTEFFVASVAEGIEIRHVLSDVNVNVFNGAMPGTIDDLVAHRLTPLVISLEQLTIWRQAAKKSGETLPVGLHLDTGMRRTGLQVNEIEAIADNDDLLDGMRLRHVMSHLASADEIDSTQPEIQLAEFERAIAVLPAATLSLANSAGIHRGPEYHFDLVRPGVSLYGGAPSPDKPNPMEHAVVLEAPMMQIYDVHRGDRVGYGATYEVVRPARHAVLALGYADGFLRSSSNRGRVWVAGVKCPIVGRVSMDLTIIDVTRVPVANLELGAAVEVIGSNRLVDDVATDAGTIAHELLTDLGGRYEVVFEDD